MDEKSRSEWIYLGCHYLHYPEKGFVSIVGLMGTEGIQKEEEEDQVRHQCPVQRRMFLNLNPPSPSSQSSLVLRSH